MPGVACAGTTELSCGAGMSSFAEHAATSTSGSKRFMLALYPTITCEARGMLAETPYLALGEVAFLEVTDVTQIGAFVDWGLGKELLVPFAEQSRELRVGERHPFGLYVDKHRPPRGHDVRRATCSATRRRVALDEWIEGEAWRNDPDIGLFVIVERALRRPRPRERAAPRSRAARPRGFASPRCCPTARSCCRCASTPTRSSRRRRARSSRACRAPGAPRVGDRSSPEEIRALFGLSKKAFKRAVGHLLKTHAVTIDRDGFVVSPRR